MIKQYYQNNLLPAIIIFILIIIAACQFSENRHIKRTVKKNELIGTWKATQFAMKSLKQTGHKNHLNQNDHQLILNADGTCKYKSFQNYFIAINPDSQYVNINDFSQCKWVLKENNQYEKQHINITLSTTPKGNRGPYFYIDEQEGRLILWQYCADPDLWKYMEFKKSH